MYPNDYIKNLVSNLPKNPGVYQMKDENGNVIYVGKAICLKNRVRQYFQKNNKSKRIENMVKLIRDIEYIVVKNEVEALALECNYIKEKSPKFNVMLKDDKTYPYLKVTIKEKYPTVYITRRKIEDGNLYLGPYTDVSSIKQTMLLIKEIFPLKRCRKNIDKRNGSPCLYYHIGRCMAPCSKDIDQIEYKNMINQVVSFLQGKKNEVKNELIKMIDEKIEKLEFEKASVLKSRLEAIEKIYQKQDVSNLNEINSDIIGYIFVENTLYIQIFKIRNYKIVFNDNLVFSDIAESELEENLISIISRYYEEKEDIPNKIYVNVEDNSIDLLKKYFEMKNMKIECIVPKKGQKINLIRMVENNIKINLENKKQDVISKLSTLLNISDIDSIECFDISNLKNDYIVGCMIRYEDGKLNKSMYRRYKIKSTLTQDDPKCMAEVISRRIKRQEEWPLPDVFLIDGGKTQLSKVKEILEKEQDISTYVYGMVKNDKHKTRALMELSGNEIIIENDKSILNFITFLQDEIHRYTISYHRSLRDKIKE